MLVMTGEMSLIDRVLRVIVLATVVSNVLASGDRDIPVLVSRRLSGDGYRYLNNDFPICHDNLTYLVSEDRCAKDQELFEDCGFAFVPSGEPSNLSIALVLIGSNLRIADPDASHTDATIVSIINGTHQLVNGSVCQISSLEVYRGRSQITEISYDGLSLSGNGTVKVDRGSLSYNLSEYLGELYRMNLSCAGEGLPENGCLFFKWIGLTDLTYAKFDSTVRGTLNHLINPEQTIYLEATTQQATTTTQTASIDATNSTLTDALSNSTLTDALSNSTAEPTGIDLVPYVSAGAGGGIAILFIVILILCVFVYRLTYYSREPTCTPAQEVHLQDQDYTSRVQGESLYSNILDSQFDTVNVITDQSEDQGVHMERRGQIERPFVPVNQNHQSRIQYQMSIGTGASAINLTTASEVTLRRTRSQEGNLDVVTFETFKPKLKEKRSISWSTAWETSTVAASRSVDRELSQIYDTVKPLATNARDERAMGFSKLSHPGYPIRELLPSMYTDAPSSLMLYASLHADNDHHGSTYDVPRRAALAYSVPDVKKRREKEQESKKQSYNTTVNPEEMSMFNDFNGHYDTPKCKYTVDKETTANSNISSLYDQPRFVKPNFGFNYKSPTGKEKSEKFEK